MIRDEFLKREQAVRSFHDRTDRGKFRGWNCSCDYEFAKMLSFKEAFEEWLS